MFSNTPFGALLVKKKKKPVVSAGAINMSKTELRFLCFLHRREIIIISVHGGITPSRPLH